MESVKRCPVKEIGQAPITAVCIKNFMKENNLMTVKNIFIIADASNRTKYKKLDKYLKFLNLFDNSQVGHNFPCNILIKLHVGCEMLDERPKLSKKKKN